MTDQQRLKPQTPFPARRSRMVRIVRDGWLQTLEVSHNEGGSVVGAPLLPSREPFSCPDPQKHPSGSVVAPLFGLRECMDSKSPPMAAMQRWHASDAPKISRLTRQRSIKTDRRTNSTSIKANDDDLQAFTFNQKFFCNQQQLLTKDRTWIDKHFDKRQGP